MSDERPELKLCVDCKHFRKESPMMDGVYGQCRRQALSVCPVTGRKDYAKALEERERPLREHWQHLYSSEELEVIIKSKCGPDGIYWEAKEA